MDKKTTPTEVEFPASQRDLFPAAAQAVYIAAYKQSMAEAGANTDAQLSRDSAAVRDAWNAVRREFVQDDVTHKWRRIGEAAAVSAPKAGLFGRLKALFVR